MMVYPTGRSTSRCFLIWYMPSPHCNGCFAPSPHTQNQLVQHFLREYAGQSIRVISSLSSSSSTAKVQFGRALSSIKKSLGQWHLGTDAHGEEVPPQNSDPRLQTLYRKCGAQFARSA
ncbi:hypothetical protein TNCV_5073931 [Trichonephila clavipes]|nr:hypothetical protein TNCV_5073931 [Trichonephila clavipes]